MQSAAFASEPAQTANPAIAHTLDSGPVGRPSMSWRGKMLSVIRRSGRTSISRLRDTPSVWSMVLAGGNGSRLAAMTRDAQGRSVPKQFCSLAGGPSLLDEAIARAMVVAPQTKTRVVVTEAHRCHWEPATRSLGADSIISQPDNRGTAIGILRAVLEIVGRDPAALILSLPADHHVRREAVLARCLRELVRVSNADPSRLYLLGIKPDRLDPDLGYILPGDKLGSGALAVGGFVEKPDRNRARELLARGAVWNSFIFAARGSTILNLLPASLRGIAGQMWRALRHRDQTGDESMLDDLYRRLPTLDFSQSVLQSNEQALRLVTSPECGWNDLGTPARVWRALSSLRHRRPPQRSGWVPSALTLAHPLARSTARADSPPQLLLNPMSGSLLLPS
jgi:mannose-1-phosphate guanylyltransferase